MESMRNLVHLLLHQLSVRGDRTGFYVKKEGVYHGITFLECFQDVQSLAMALSSLGVAKGDAVALLSHNRFEWAVADLAILSLGAINVPIYATLTGSEIAYMLKDSQAKVLIAETAEHLEKVLVYKDTCPHLETLVLMDTVPDGHSDVFAYAALLEKGRNITSTDCELYLDRLDSISQSDIASIVYTSGTTGNPKGVVLTHGNFLANIRDILAAIPLSSEDVVLSFLPLSHVFERTAGYYTLLAIGGTIYYAESIDTVRSDIALAKPTAMISVPRLYEKMHAGILDSLSGVKKTLFYWALKVGQQWHNALTRHGRVPFILRVKHFLAYRLVHHKVKQRMGGRLRFFVSGGAPLSKELGRFFSHLGILIIEGYGLTETAPVIACNRVNAYKFGTVGKALPSQDVRLADDGELIVRGPNVMRGYHNLPDATAEVIDENGFFHTGDIAEIDAEGFIRIVDRKKEIIVLSNGKKVPPQMVELRLTASKFISQAVVVGENHNYLTALLVPDFIKLHKWARTRNIDTEDVHALLMHKDVQAFYYAVIKKALSELASFEQIKKFLLLPQEFSPELGEVTPSLKLRRKVIYKKYETEISLMYTDGQTLVPEIDEKMLADADT
jgi:long-chain acyl-CoA synthetase